MEHVLTESRTGGVRRTKDLRIQTKFEEHELPDLEGYRFFSRRPDSHWFYRRVEGEEPKMWRGEAYPLVHGSNGPYHDVKYARVADAAGRDPVWLDGEVVYLSGGFTAEGDVLTRLGLKLVSMWWSIARSPGTSYGIKVDADFLQEQIEKHDLNWKVVKRLGHRFIYEVKHKKPSVHKSRVWGNAHRNREVFVGCAQWYPDDWTDLKEHIVGMEFPSEEAALKAADDYAFDQVYGNIFEALASIEP